MTSVRALRQMAESRACGQGAPLSYHGDLGPYGGGSCGGMARLARANRRDTGCTGGLGTEAIRLQRQVQEAVQAALSRYEQVGKAAPDGLQDVLHWRRKEQRRWLQRHHTGQRLRE